MANERLEYKLVVKDLASGALKEVSLNATQADKALENVKKETDNLSGSFKKMSNNLSENKVLETTKKEANALSGSFKQMAGVLSVGALYSFGKEVVLTTAKFQSLRNAINTASETAQQGELNFEWIKRFSSDYGLEVESVAEGFKTLRGAMMNTKFTSTDTRRMFEQVSKGVVALGLSSEDAKGTFLALGQMMGKGKVQAEELRGQIGERIPGAFAIAARAMGMTTAELDKFMQDGKLMAEDFLPKFASEMEKTFGKSAENNAHGLTQEINRMSSAWTNLITAIGESDSDGLMGKTFNKISIRLNEMSNWFKSNEQIAKESASSSISDYLANLEERTTKYEKTLKGGKANKSVLLEAYSKREIATLNEQLQATSKDLNALKSSKDEFNSSYAGRKAKKLKEERLATLEERKAMLMGEISGATQYFDKKTSDLFKNNTLNNQSKNSSDLSSSVTKSARTSDIKNITINIGKMIEDLQIVTQSDAKIVTAIEREVKKVIALAVNDFNALAN